MNNINYLFNIRKEVNDKKILFRVGYKNGITKMSDAEKVKIINFIKSAKSLCSLKGAYAIYKIKKNNNGILIDEKNYIKSKSLLKLLNNSNEIILMASTVGNEIIKERDRQIKKGDPVYGVILDATASEIADAGLDWIQEFVNLQLLKKGLKLTMRYSPGYGDLDISVQKIIYKMLNLKKLGIKITEKYLLIPEKSVLAISGIYNILIENNKDINKIL